MGLYARNSNTDEAPKLTSAGEVYDSRTEGRLMSLIKECVYLIAFLTTFYNVFVYLQVTNLTENYAKRKSSLIWMVILDQ